MNKTLITLVVGLTVVVIIILVLAPTGHGTYNVLKDFQTMIGAIVGLFGLGLVAFWNADLARERDDRLHNRDQRAVANLLATEFSIIRLAATRYREFYEKSGNIPTSQFEAMMGDPDLMPPYGQPPSPACPHQSPRSTCPEADV